MPHVGSLVKCASVLLIECVFKGRNALECGLLQSCFPEPPPEWDALESPMELVGPDLEGRAVIGDDKDHSKIWVADQVDLNRFVAGRPEAS